MKIWTTLALALALVLTLAACGEVGAPPAPPSPDEDYMIEDISFTEGKDYADALETFWEDDEYEYVFSAIMSHDCTVTYSNGATENVVDALEAGRVTVEDLERFDIRFTRKPVPTDIVDIRPVESDGDTVAHALRIVEGDLAYMVGAERYVVEYASGEVESLDYAVRHGRVSVADLDRFGIPYVKEESKTDGDGKQGGASYEYVTGEDGEGKLVVSGGGSYVITDVDPDKLEGLFPDMGEAKPYDKSAGE